MHLSTHTWMRPEPLEQTLSRISKLGYKSIELEGEPDAYNTTATRHSLDKYRTRCWGAVTTMQGRRHLIAANEEERKATVQYMKGVVILSASLDGEIGAIVPSRVGKLVRAAAPENEWQWAIEGLRGVAAFARDQGIRLALEPPNRFETYFINRIDQALALADAVEGGVGIAFDPLHLDLEEKDLFAAVKACGQRIPDVHIADHNRLAAGDGFFDWPKTIAALQDAGYGGGLAVKCVPPIDRTPVGLYGNARLAQSAVAVNSDRLQFLIAHGSDVLAED